MTRPVALIVCAALVTGIPVAGCGSDEGDTAATSTAAGSGEATSTEQGKPAGGATATDQVEISNFKFEPETITVDAGTKVTWTNGDDAAHTATADDGSFDTDTLNRDDSGSATFEERGSYSYYCRFHAFMKATVEVK